MAETKAAQLGREAMKLVEEIRAQQKDYRADAKAYQQKRSHSLTDKAINAQRTMRKTGISVRNAKTALISRFDYLSKQDCRTFFDRMHEMLPTELRHQIYDEVIEQMNATVYHDKEKSIKFYNGASSTIQFLDAEYTGKDVHRDIMAYLCRNGKNAVFNFRHSHDAIGEVFEQYPEKFGFDMAHQIPKISVALNTRDIKDREAVVSRLEPLRKFERDSNITFIVETGNLKRKPMRRYLRQVVCAFIGFFHTLVDAGYIVNIVMNPASTRSVVKNGSGTNFNIVDLNRPMKYNFSVKGAETTAKSIEMELLKYLEMYGDQWSFRT